jgi:hypothetical protein
MFGLGNNPTVRGKGFMVLNVLRALNMIGLLGMATSNMILCVKGAMNGSFTGFGFFALVSGLLTSLFSIFLLISEIDLGKISKFFHSYFPVLSTTHSLGWLGVVLVFLAVDLLGKLNAEEYSIKNLSLPFWRLCLASAILCFVFGFLNLLSTLVFREHDSDITDRLIRTSGRLAQTAKSLNDEEYYAPYPHSSDARSYDDEKRAGKFAGAAARMTRFFGGKGSSTRPQISHPMPVPASVAEDRDLENQTVVASELASEKKAPRRSPVLPDIERPPTAMHPFNRNGAESSANRYSVVSDMTRF